MHKKNTFVKEHAGIVLVFSVLIIFIFLFIFNLNNVSLSFLFLSFISLIICIAFIGLVDDHFDLLQKLKASLSFIPSFFLIPLFFNLGLSTSIFFPIIGNIEFGFIYVFLLVPWAVAILSNLINMLAGFNGIETILPLLMFVSLFFCIFIYYGPNNVFNDEFKFFSIMICVIMIALLSSTYFFTKYPSKIFLGDVGHLFIGSIYAYVTIISKLEFFAFIIALPYIIEFFIKLIKKFPKAFCEIDKKEMLFVKNNKRTIPHFLFDKKISEKELIKRMIIFQSFFCILSLILAFIL